jgi:AcrR family transcriptional regulator
VARTPAHQATSRTRPPTRERILDCAWWSFVSRGFDGTTVTEIEAAAGLAAGSGSFYRHFASKEDVLRAAVDREIERIDSGRELPPSRLTGDVRVGLALEFQRRLANLQRMQSLVTVLAREERHLGDSTRRLHELLVEKNLSLRADILQSWMDQGAIPPRDPHALATVILSALTGYQFARQFFGESPGGVDEATFVGTLADLVLSD